MEKDEGVWYNINDVWYDINTEFNGRLTAPVQTLIDLIKLDQNS